MWNHEIRRVEGASSKPCTRSIPKHTGTRIKFKHFFKTTTKLIRLPQNVVKVDLIICDLCVI